MSILVNIDGEVLPPGEARVSVFDHGFLYGDSVYETVRTHGGRCFLLERHMQRLELSAGLIGLPLPPGGSEWIASQVERTVAAAGNSESAVRVTLTRGEGPIGIDPRLCPRPSLVVIVRPLEPLPEGHYQDGVAVVVARTVRNSPRALDPRIKSGNFLNNILAAREAIAAGAFEALMLNHQGHVAEGTQSNLFVGIDGAIATPGGDSGLLHGITRALVIELCTGSGIEIAERDVFVAELYEADEIFLTSTLKGVLPVTALGGRAIGDGRPGKLTQRIAGLYRDLVETFLDEG